MPSNWMITHAMTTVMLFAAQVNALLAEGVVGTMRTLGCAV
ncbi:hypothetical protein [Paraburkholderia sp. RAU2J]|nr:hypothetical protein [Paraburkholderia sp. RAU2J]